MDTMAIFFTIQSRITHNYAITDNDHNENSKYKLQIYTEKITTTLSQQKGDDTILLVHVFTKYSPIFKILSLLQSLRNLQQK